MVKLGVKLVLCCHWKGHTDLSAEHSMPITIGYCCCPACGQVLKLWQATASHCSALCYSKAVSSGLDFLKLYNKQKKIRQKKSGHSKNPSYLNNLKKGSCNFFIILLSLWLTGPVWGVRVKNTSLLALVFFTVGPCSSFLNNSWAKHFLDVSLEALQSCGRVLAPGQTPSAPKKLSIYDSSA